MCRVTAKRGPSEGVEKSWGPATHGAPTMGASHPSMGASHPWSGDVDGHLQPPGDPVGALPLGVRLALAEVTALTP